MREAALSRGASPPSARFSPQASPGGGSSDERGRATGFIPLIGGAGTDSSPGARRDPDDAELRRVASGKARWQGEATAAWSCSRSSSGSSLSSSSSGSGGESGEDTGHRGGGDVPEYDGEALLAVYKARAPVLLYVGAMVFSVATVAAIVLLAVFQAHIYDPTGWIVLVAASVPCGLFLLFLLASAPKEVLFTPYSVVLRTQRRSRWFGHVIPLHDVRDVRRLGPCEWRGVSLCHSKGRLSGLAGGGVLIVARHPSRSVVFSPADHIRFWEDQQERMMGGRVGE